MNRFRHLKDIAPVWEMPDTITDLITSFVRRLQHCVHFVLCRLYFPCVSHLFEKCLTQSLIWWSHLLGDCSIAYILSWVGYTSHVLLCSFCFNCVTVLLLIHFSCPMTPALVTTLNRWQKSKCCFFVSLKELALSDHVIQKLVQMKIQAW